MNPSKGLLSVIFLLACVVGNAQFKKGMRMVGTNIASVVFNSGEANNTVAQIGSNKSHITNYDINISPSMGWFLSDNTVLGATLFINPNGNKTTYEQNGSTYQSDKTRNMNFGAGAFVRYYLKSSGSLMPFGQLGFNTGINNLKTEGFFYGGSGLTAYKTTYDGNSDGGFFLNTSVQAGFTKMIGEVTGLDFFIGYNYAYNKSDFTRNTTRDIGNNGSIDETGQSVTTTKFTNSGFLFGIGFQVFLKGKSK